MSDVLGQLVMKCPSLSRFVAITMHLVLNIMQEFPFFSACVYKLYPKATVTYPVESFRPQIPYETINLLGYGPLEMKMSAFLNI